MINVIIYERESVNMNFCDFENRNILKYDLSLASVCTMKTGGNAKYAFFPNDKNDIRDIISFLKNNNIKCNVIGNGSNVIYPDEGYDGAVIIMSNMKNAYAVLENDKKVSVDMLNSADFKCPKVLHVYADAGLSLTSFAIKMCRCGYAGLEFAYGIPASIGGATYIQPAVP